MNICCGSRKSTIKRINNEIIVTVTCKCNRFIAAHLFDELKYAQAWSKEKILMKEVESNAA